MEVTAKHMRSWKRRLAIAALPSFALPLSGCGKLDGTISSVFERPAIQDFKKSEIISNGPGVADGQSELLVVIQLMNSDGSSVKLFKPTYEVISGSGVTPSPCTTSNENGVSTCVLKAVQAGTKRISVTNITIPLQADLVFNLPAARKTLFGLSSASNTQTQSGFKLQATVGSQEPGPPKASGAFKIYGGVQGEAFSR